MAGTAHHVTHTDNQSQVRNPSKDLPNAYQTW
jgi:hypothetical protein